MIKNTLQKLKELVLDTFFPKQCIHCEKYGAYLCRNCKYKHIEYYSVNLCHVCKNEVFNLPEGMILHNNCRYLTNLNEVLVSLKYSKLIKKILKEIKYNFHFDIVNLVVDLMLENIDISKLRESLLVPVPLHRAKKLYRGFNQAELIAAEIAKRLNKLDIVTSVINILRRTRKTKTQVGMTKEQRQQNLKQAFCIASKSFLKFKNRKIFLIDDVMTTGTTLEECGEVLKKNGFQDIRALVFARG